MKLDSNILQLESLDTQSTSANTSSRILDNAIQNYLPYSTKSLVDLKTLKQILESCALKSTGLKKKISKIEYLKILT